MPATNITVVTVTFGNAVKREEYGPMKKAEVTIVANVGEGEDGAAALDEISNMALAKVAALLSAPRPEITITLEAGGINRVTEAEEAAVSGEAPARRTRGPNKAKADATSVETAPANTEESPEAAKPTEPVEDEWAAGAEDIVVTDQELLAATSKRAGELGAREPIVSLIATFATRTEGAPFKVQEIPQNQRKDYLQKLEKLAA